MIGRIAGENITYGVSNVAIGHAALTASNTTGGGSNGGSENYNIAIGNSAMGAETSGAEYCVAVGHNALAAQNGDVKNTAVGGLAGDAIVGGEENTLLGYTAGSGIVGGGYNTALGHEAYKIGTGSYNTVIGARAIGESTGTAASGNDNVIIGYNAGFDLEDGPGNVIIGKSAGKDMTTGDYNVIIGTSAADAMTGDSNYNVAIGTSALGGEASGADHCIAIGGNALVSQNDADAVNLAIGMFAGDAINSGTYNVLIGHEAGSTLTSQDSCTAVGYQALKLASGASNTAVGSVCLDALGAGVNNTAVGYGAMGQADNEESGNTAVGTAALWGLNVDDGDFNVGLGYHAGRYLSNGSTAVTDIRECTYLGANAKGSAATGVENEIAIGYNTVGIGTDTVALGNTDVTAIKGQVDFAAYSDRRIKRDITNNDTGLAFIEKLQPVTFKHVNPADYPEAIREGRWSETTRQEVVSKAVEAADAVYEDVVVQKARAAVEEVTETIEHPAEDAVYEDIVHPAKDAVYEDRVVVHAEPERTETRVVQEAREEIKGERHKHDEVEVSEDVEKVEMVKGEGDNYVRKVTTETVTRTARTPLYDDHPVVNEDGTPCLNLIEHAVEAKEAVTEERQKLDDDGNGVVDENGDPVMETVVIEEAVEAKDAVTEQVIHKCPVMEEYIVQEAQDEVTETITIPAVEEVTERVLVSEAKEEHTERRLVTAAKEAWTETRVVRPAEAAVEEVKERRLVSEAVEAADAVYETVTVPADARPADNDTVRLGLIAQDVQAALTEVGLSVDIVDESPDGKLSLKYGSLVMPLIKAVQELSARVKTLEG